MSDEDAERMRQQRKREEKDREYRARLSRWETRERGKLQALEKDKQARYFEQQDNDRRRQTMLEKCASFDDDEQAEHGEELFIVDRYDIFLLCLRPLADHDFHAQNTLA